MNTEFHFPGAHDVQADLSLHLTLVSEGTLCHVCDLNILEKIMIIPPERKCLLEQM